MKLPLQEVSLMNARTESAHQALTRPGSMKETVLLRAHMYFFYSTMAMLVSYLPLYFADRGFTPSQIGLIYASGPAVSIAGNLLTGLASDKYRTIKKLLVLLFAGQLLMLIALQQVEAFGWVLAIMTVFYLFQTPVQPLSDSLALLSAAHTGRNYPSIRIYGSIGFAFSAFAIGLLLKEQGSGFTVTVILALVALSLCASFTLRDYQGEVRKMEFSGLFALIRKPSIVAFFAITLILSVAHRMYEGFLALTLREMGASQSLIGSAWLTSALSEIPVLYLLGKYGHKLKELPLLAVAAFMYALRYFLMSRLEDPSYVILLQLMHSVSFGIFFSTSLRYMTYLLPDEFRSSGQALYAVVWAGIAGVVSGTVGGYWFETFGPQWFFMTASLFAAAAGAGFIALHLTGRNR